MTLRLPLLEEVRVPEFRHPELIVDSWSSTSCRLLIRGLTREGIFQFEHTPNADRTRAYDIYRVDSVPVCLQVHVAPISTRRGQVYARVALRIGGIALYRLCAGYVEGPRALTWPPGFHEPMVGGRGYLRTVTGTDPAAGSEISETVPTNARWRLLAIRFELVTSTTVATRRVNLVIDDGSDTIFERESPATQAADLTRRYNFAAVGYAETAFTSDDVVLGIPALILPQGYRVRTSTTNLQSGDNYGAPILMVEEWLEE